MNPLKNIQAELSKRTIEVRKFPSTPITALSVFRLAVEWTMYRKAKPLRFIQVGANDGVFGDPIRPYVIESAWEGILVEPQLDVFESLKKNYSNNASQLIFENVAIASGGEPLVLYRAPSVEVAPGAEMPHSLTVTSFSADVVSRQTGVPKAELVRLEVPSVTLDKLVEQHGFQDFDVLQIDVEGFDFAVLQTLTLSKYRPSVIQFEHGHLGLKQVEQMTKLLSANNYVLYWGGRQTDSLAMPAELFN